MDKGELFNTVAAKAVEHIFKSYDKKTKDDKVFQMKLAAFILGFFLFIGSEAVKIVFRSDFGAKGINIYKIFVCFICFLIWGLVPLFAFSNEPISGGVIGAIISLLFFVILAFHVLLKGIRENNKANDQENNRKKGKTLPQDFEGKSVLLSFLLKDGWSETKIQNIAEPLLTFAIGVFFLAISPPASIAIIFCSISIWTLQIYNYVFGYNKVRETLSNHGYETGSEESFSKVILNR